MSLSILVSTAVASTALKCPELFDNPQNGMKACGGTMKVYHVKPGVDYAYIRPPNSRYYNFLYKDFGSYFRTTFNRPNLPYIGAMVVGTGLLVYFDQDIIDGAQHIGDEVGLNHTSKQKPLTNWGVKVGGKTIGTPLNVPQDLETGMYFLGDGIVHSSIAVGFWGYGQLSGDKRALQTGTQCIEAIVATGTMIQILKHSFGRESPNARTVDGGKWRLFPNPSDYQNHVPNYDAMPSGHIATAMATVTVIADNYPDKKWIRPMGYSLMGILMYAMLNNGVHWASDYPLGISIGYTFAKICDGRARTILSGKGSEEVNGKVSKRDHISLLPYLGNNSMGLRLGYEF
ncbi:MAG: phosphatase PAP2 family protein [Calditrichaeota bacterium]|nr:phosphatase PAP2 family protein [Calditrichota bacterium]MCB9369877.1 phosphatase PAP2 family protein [Calditrichota bacterium]